MYFKILKAENLTDHLVKWNIAEFTRNGTYDGFIIQHMHINSKVLCVKNDDYWESWKIEKGIMDSGKYEYDDNWSPIPSYLLPFLKQEIMDSDDGTIIYKSEVYYVPFESEISSVIQKWRVVPSSPANELPMTYDFKIDVSSFYICSREYRWNYKELIKMSMV